MGETELRALNQLDILRDKLRAGPTMVRPGFTPELIAALLEQDRWYMSLAVPRSAWNGNNPSLPLELGTFEPPSASVWTERLTTHRAQITRAIPHVGRLETTRLGTEKVEGTGWLVRNDVVVTNRHVARGIAGSIASQEARLRIDFLEEDGDNHDGGADGPESASESRVLEILYMAPEDPFDLAFLRIEPRGSTEDAMIELHDHVEVGMDVCAIGYPALRDTIYTEEYFYKMFGSLLGSKRLSPGSIVEASPERVSHDCATVGGSSGSVILDIASGKAVALNYGERDRVNDAVPARVIRERLAQL